MNTPKPLLLAAEHKEKLEKLVKSGMTPAIIVQRAKILILKADGRSNDSVAEELGINKRTVLLWTKKYRNRSANETLDDILSVSEGRGPKEEISGEAKTWITGIACQKPKDLGYAAETWTNSALTRHIRQHTAAAGYQRFRKAVCLKFFQKVTLSHSVFSITAGGLTRTSTAKCIMSFSCTSRSCFSLIRKVSGSRLRVRQHTSFPMMKNPGSRPLQQPERISCLMRAMAP